MALKEYQRAIEDFDNAIEMNPKNIRIYSERGLAYLWLKDAKRARSDFAVDWCLDAAITPKDWHRINSGWLIEWIDMRQEISDPKLTERLEAIAAVDPQNYLAYVCCGVALWRRECFMESLAELEKAIPLDPEKWDPYFWKGMICASLQQDEEAVAMIEKALELGLPPLLLIPLRWLEQNRPDFYQKFVVPLFARYELIG